MSLFNNPPVGKYTSEQKGYMLVHDLWQIGTDSIHDMCVVNNDSLYHQNKLQYKCLQTEDKEKKRK